MNSNKGFSPVYGSHWSHLPPKPPVNEDLLKSAHVQVERKTFNFSLKENIRGRLLRITEDSGNRRNTIIIPSTGLKDFQNMLEEMIKAANELRPAQSSSSASIDSSGK